MRRGYAVALIGLLMCGCASIHYDHTHAGKLSGRLIVEWRNPDLFIFRPDASSPLVFVRSDATAIQPGEMFTDGGSIPRPFWVFRNYSPWGYGPAFIVHDWLFHMHNCKLPGYEKFTLNEAAVVMSEVMKTMMETPGFDYGDKSTVYLMYTAVQTPPAEEAWNNGRCSVAPPPGGLAAPPDQVFVVEFPPRRR